jgi:hypothetical protein
MALDILAKKIEKIACNSIARYLYFSPWVERNDAKPEAGSDPAAFYQISSTLFNRTLLT